MVHIRTLSTNSGTHGQVLAANSVAHRLLSPGAPIDWTFLARGPTMAFTINGRMEPIGVHHKMVGRVLEAFWRVNRLQFLGDLTASTSLSWRLTIPYLTRLGMDRVGLIGMAWVVSSQVHHQWLPGVSIVWTSLGLEPIMHITIKPLMGTPGLLTGKVSVAHSSASLQPFREAQTQSTYSALEPTMDSTISGSMEPTGVDGKV